MNTVKSWMSDAADPQTETIPKEEFETIRQRAASLTRKYLNKQTETIPEIEKLNLQSNSPLSTPIMTANNRIGTKYGAKSKSRAKQIEMLDQEKSLSFKTFNFSDSASTSKKKLHQHQPRSNKQTNVSQPKPSFKKSNSKKFQCPECDKQYMNKRDCRYHYNKKHDESKDSTLKCQNPQCISYQANTAFLDENDFQNHVCSDNKCPQVTPCQPCPMCKHLKRRHLSSRKDGKPCDESMVVIQTSKLGDKTARCSNKSMACPWRTPYIQSTTHIYTWTPNSKKSKPKKMSTQTSDDSSDTKSDAVKCDASSNTNQSNSNKNIKKNRKRKFDASGLHVMRSPVRQAPVLRASQAKSSNQLSIPSWAQPISIPISIPRSIDNLDSFTYVLLCEGGGKCQQLLLFAHSHLNEHIADSLKCSNYAEFESKLYDSMKEEEKTIKAQEKSLGLTVSTTVDSVTTFNYDTVFSDHIIPIMSEKMLSNVACFDWNTGRLWTQWYTFGTMTWKREFSSILYCFRGRMNDHYDYILSASEANRFKESVLVKMNEYQLIAKAEVPKLVEQAIDQQQKDLSLALQFANTN